MPVESDDTVILLDHVEDYTNVLSSSITVPMQMPHDLV